MHRIPALPLLALTLIGAPLMAQNSVRDFTLPQPTPTATPQVQGPADDTGVVPIGPRVIPSESSVPQPSTRPTATASPAPVATATPTAAPTGQTRVTPRVQPSAQRIPQATTQPAQPLEVGPQPIAPSPLDSGLSLPPAPATASPQAAASTATESGASKSVFPVWLQLALGGLVLLSGLLAIWAVMLRRKRQASAPVIERPIVHERTGSAAPLAAAEEISFDTRIEIESLSRSFRMVTLNYRIQIANRSARTMRDLGFAADLVSAARGNGAGDQLATTMLKLPAAGEIDRIGPHQSRSISAKVQMPVESIEVFAQGQVPMFIPLLRLKLHGAEIEAQAQTYAIGLGGVAEGRVNPLPLNDPLGSYKGVRAVRVDQRAG